VIQKPVFSEEQESASTKLQKPIIPLGIPMKKNSDTAFAAPAESRQPISMEGDLKDHMFPQLLQYMHNARKTGELLIESKGQQAIIGFQKGNITFAMLSDELGIGVIHTLACWREGTFRFKSMEEMPRPKNVVHPTMTIILKCCQILDENPD